MHTLKHVVSGVCLQVLLGFRVPLVLQVQGSKETKETKEQQVGQDLLVAVETLVLQVQWSVYAKLKEEVRLF